MRHELGWALVAAGCVAIVGCDDKKGGAPTAAPTATSIASVAPSSSAPEIPSAAPSAAASGSAAPAPVALHFRAGPAALFLDAAQGAELDDATRANVEKLADQLDEIEDDAPSTEMRAIHAEIVTGVREGTLDATKLTPRVAILQKTVQQRLEKEALSMNALYAALTPEARKGTVAEVQRLVREREDDGPKGGDAGAVPDPLTGRAKKLPDRLKKELALDPGQVEKLEPILAKLPPDADAHADAHKRLDNAVVAFTQPTFEAKRLDAFSLPAAKARVPLDREIAFLAQLLPILTPEQRAALSGRLEGEQLRVGTGAPPSRVKDWPFPFELQSGDDVSGLAGTVPRTKGGKGGAPRPVPSGSSSGATSPPKKPPPPHAKGE